jgi:hypothetical protein
MSAAVLTSASDFLAGRDLAVRMLRHMESADDCNVCSIEARYRDGAPQKNVALSYLLNVIRQPQLLEGFAAVISDGFNGGGFADADLYARLTVSEMRGAQHDSALQALLSAVLPKD